MSQRAKNSYSGCKDTWDVAASLLEPAGLPRLLWRLIAEGLLAGALSQLSSGIHWSLKRWEAQHSFVTVQTNSRPNGNVLVFHFPFTVLEEGRMWPAQREASITRATGTEPTLADGTNGTLKLANQNPYLIMEPVLSSIFLFL